MYKLKEKLKDKNVQAIVLCLIATGMAIVSAITTDGAIVMKAIYIALSIFFFIGSIISIKKYIANKRENNDK